MIPLTDFCTKVPYLYHLTDPRNYPLILKHRILYSASALITKSNLPDQEDLLRNRRENPLGVPVGKETFFLRSQKKISPAGLEKCLAHGFTVEEFMYELNRRVFFWRHEKRVTGVFYTTQTEKPCILRFPTRELLQANDNKIFFSRVNSAAPRLIHLPGGREVPRDKDIMYQTPEQYEGPLSSIVEAVFEMECKLPPTFDRSDSPDLGWEPASL